MIEDYNWLRGGQLSGQYGRSASHICEGCTRTVIDPLACRSCTLIAITTQKNENCSKTVVKE